MRTKRIIAILMTVMLLAGTVQNLGVFVRAVETVTPPEVVISGVRVTSDGTDSGPETGYLEVSVHATTTDFQSVGVVLSYDTGVLTPVDWNTTGSTVPISGTMWTTVVPSKGADNFSGKPALAREGDTTEPGEGETEAPAAAARGYLYLGAESLQYQPVTDTRLVTVRFKIAPEGSGYKDVKVPTAEADLQNENLTLCLAPEKIAETAAPAAPVLLSRGEAAEIVEGELNSTAVHVLKFYTWHADASEENCAVSFRIGKGESINAGTAQPTGGGYAITFFDWDGRVIDAISCEENAAAAVEAWQQHAAIQARLSNKSGYEFDQWLVVYENNDGEGLHTKGGTFTSNDMALATGNTDVADLSNISGYTNKEKDGDSKAVLLQASYKATDAVNQGAGVGESATSSKTYYTFSEPTFYQYGSVDANNGQYAVRYTVERGSAIRAKEPVVMALVYVGDKYLTVKVDLENTDTTDFEVVVPKATTSIQCQVLDGSTNAAWIFGRPRNEFSISANAKIVKNGAFDRLMEEAVNAAASGTWSSDINTQIFIDAGYTGVNNATRLADAQAKLVAAVNSNGGNKLSDTQANSALTGYGSFTRVK